MSIILKYIMNNLKERKMRTVVMLLSVILSITLIFVSLAIGDSYSSAQKKMAKGIGGTATLSVSALPGVNGEMVWISEDAIPNLASIKNKVGILQTTALFREDGHFENFDIIASDLKKLNLINKPRLLDGGELHDFTGYQVVLPEKFTSKYGIRIGDKLKLQIRGESFEFQVNAIAAYDTVFLRQTRGFNALIPIDTLKEILDTKNKYSEVLIEPGIGVYTDTLKAELSKVTSTKSFNIKKIINDTQVEADAREKSMPFFLISFFSLIMSVFIIYSSYKVITIERLQVLGTFRSIGATDKAVTRILMMESLLYGLLGGLLGIPIGLVVLKLLLKGLGKSLSQGIEIPMVVLPLNIILSCIVAIAVSLFSAYIPVRRASKLPVKDIVMGAVQEKNISNRVKYGFGIILLILSNILPRIADGQMLIPAGGFSLFGLVIATIIVIPLCVTGLSSLLERVYGFALGNVGKLGARNMKRNKNINQNITLLFISISSVIVISVVGSFLNTYIGDVFKGATLDGFADANMSREFVQKVRSIEGMEAVLPIYVLYGSIHSEGQSLGRVEAVEDLMLYDDMLAIKYDSENLRNNIETSFNNSRNILLSSDLQRQLNIKVGDTLNLSSSVDGYQYHVAGIYKSRASGAAAIIPAVYAVSDFKAKDYSLLAFQAVNPDAAMIQIRDLFGNNVNWSRTIKEFNADVSGVVGGFLKPLNKLTYFILLLAAVGVINNLLINYIQKRHSIAMYKSIGLSNKQNIKMTLIEGFSSGVIGAIFGVMVAYMEIKTIFLVAGPRTSMEPELEISVFVIAGVMGVVITMLGSIVPILKGSRMKIIEEIRFE